ncbi:MAG: aminotransferase class V-fold PLP-dependent enzyme [Armatimonadetes bacterium]|nr:aminotransferase class V-fold PLP-dependent enzyme [Armatimonadota bacterium]
MPSKIAADTLAINGGQQALPEVEGTGPGKIGVEEFMELADAWGYSEKAKAAIRSAIASEPDTAPLLSRYYNPRPSKVQALEEMAAAMFDIPYVLAVNSGTSALNTAYVAAGIGPGCEVIVPAYTFFATVAEVVTARAIPVIADIDESLTLDPEDVARKITPRTRAIVPVHMIGTCADMKPLLELARRHNLVVIEDAAQACGATYMGKRLGTLGDMGCFSISSYKITGGGEAGLVMTRDHHLHIRAQNNHDTGACWRPDRYAVEQEEGELFAGYNYKLSELEGAVNLAQLRKMPDQVARWQKAKRRIAGQLGRFAGVTPQQVRDPGEVGYNLIYFAPDAASAQATADALSAEGIGAGTRGGKTARDWHIYAYWQHILERKSATPDGCPWTCEKNAGLGQNYSPDMCPRALDLLGRAVFIAVNQWWTEGDCDRIASGVNKVLGAFFERESDRTGWPPAV